MGIEQRSQDWLAETFEVNMADDLLAPQEQAADQGMNAPTPEDQEAYERTVLAGIKVLSDPKTNPKIMKMLKSEGEPAKILASATTAIVTQLDEQSGGTVPEIVIMPAAGEILEQVAEFANESGVMKVDKMTQDKAAQLLVMELADTYEIDPEELQGLSEGMGEEEIQSIVSEQGAIAGEVPEEAAQPQQPAQELPGLVARTVGA